MALVHGQCRIGRPQKFPTRHKQNNEGRSSVSSIASHHRGQVKVE